MTTEQRFTDGQSVRIPVSIIRCDGGTQVRAGLNPEFLARYTALVGIAKEEAQDKAKTTDNWLDFFQPPLPDADVFFDGKEFWMADGYTRLASYKSANMPVIPVVIHLGDTRAAQFFATGANKHGQPMTDADRRRAAKILLEDDEWSGLSDREVERRTGYGRTSVAKLRAELLTHIGEDDADKTTKRTAKRNGKEYEVDTSNVKAANSTRSRKAEVKKIREQVPELADAVERQELSVEQARIIIAQRAKESPSGALEASPEAWYGTLPIYAQLQGNTEALDLLVKDLEAWRKLQNMGVFTGMASAANEIFQFNAGGGNTPLGRVMQTVAYYPHPKDWKQENYL